ncbi:MAG: methylmalonyl-CoA epimerase [Syntrophales bacterium]
MKISRIEHMGIAIKDIEKGISLYRDILGLKVTPATIEEGSGAAVAFVEIGESSFELMSPIAEPPAGSIGDVTRKFIEKRGEGIHHIAVAVDNIEAALKEIAQSGITLIDKVPRPGAHGKIAFIHPKSAHGILLELCEPAHDH